VKTPDLFNSLCHLLLTQPQKRLAPAVLKRGTMVDPIFQSDNYLLARRLLDASVLRHSAIASNIANAETPGYRRVDVAPDFAAELRARLDAGELASRASTLKPSLTEDRAARSVRPDGNNVELERELLEMNRNSVEHEFLTELVSRNIKQLKLAITGRSA
jgi:flagellar basal-body rod protein FlgB